jgi:hypothetical protein
MITRVWRKVGLGNPGREHYAADQWNFAWTQAIDLGKALVLTLLANDRKAKVGRDGQDRRSQVDSLIGIAPKGRHQPHRKSVLGMSVRRLQIHSSVLQ